MQGGLIHRIARTYALFQGTGEIRPPYHSYVYPRTVLSHAVNPPHSIRILSLQGIRPSPERRSTADAQHRTYVPRQTLLRFPY